MSEPAATTEFNDAITIANRQGKAWSPEDRRKAILAVVETGNVVNASTATGIPQVTIRRWLRDPVVRSQARREARDLVAELELEATSVLRLAFTRIRERMEVGDEVVVRTRTGEVVVVKQAVRARDVAVCIGVLLDKRESLARWAREADGLSPAEVTPEVADATDAALEGLLEEIRRRRALRTEAIDVTTAAPTHAGAREGEEQAPSDEGSEAE